MRSTSGEHYVALDHVRAVAVMMVFSWHFMHGPRGYPVPFDGTPLWSPLVLFDEGHVGVALFMTLSGYLFAKLLDGRRVNYALFFRNRLLRLMPLLLLVLVIHAAAEAFRARSAQAAFTYLLSMVQGFVLPRWPNGGWSIAVELQFYLLLPAILLLLRDKPWCVGWIVASAIIFRAAYHALTGEVQSLAYFTIFGRIDQFVFGILAFHCRNLIPGLRYWAAAAAGTLIHLYWWFDQRGGFFLHPGFPSPSLVWVLLPTCEGLLFAILIAWYDQSFRFKSGLMSSLLATIGEYSYSLYLLHFFFVFDVAAWIQSHVLDITNFYVAFPVSMAVLILALPLGYLSHRFIERPFLMLRRPYIRASSESVQTVR